MDANRRLTRSADRILAGVCGGIANYLGVDPTAVRVAYVLLTVLTCVSGILAYLIMWLIIPER